MEKVDQIIDFLRDFRNDVCRRLDSLERKVEENHAAIEANHASFVEFKDEANRRFDTAHDDRKDIREELRELRREFERYRDMLMKVYEAHHEVQVRWGWQWAFASFVMVFAASGITLVVSSVVLQ